VTRGWRKLDNEELYNLYASTNVIRMKISRRMRWAGHVTCMGQPRIAYKILARKPQGKRPPGRIGYIWESNIRVELKDICCYAVEWI
jgi:hypothetical protein